MPFPAPWGYRTRTYPKAAMAATTRFLIPFSDSPATLPFSGLGGLRMHLPTHPHFPSLGPEK